jgi:protein TonB
MMVDIFTNRDVGWLRQPIALGLLISAGFHFILLVLIQVAPVSSGHQVVVINARMQPPTSQPEPKQESLVEPLAKAEPDVSEKVMLAVVPINPNPKPNLNPSPAETAPASLPEPEVKQVVKQDVKQEPVTATSLVSLTNSGASTSGIQKPQPSTSAEVSRGTKQDTGLPSLPIGIDTHWYLARQVDKQPKAIGSIEPVYPDDAKRRDLEGTLKLMLKIDDLGRVLSAEVVEATPPGVFDKAALAAFRDARFTPAMKDGRPVRYQAYIRVDFKLED